MSDNPFGVKLKKLHQPSYEPVRGLYDWERELGQRAGVCCGTGVTLLSKQSFESDNQGYPVYDVSSTYECKSCGAQYYQYQRYEVDWGSPHPVQRADRTWCSKPGDESSGVSSTLAGGGEASEVTEHHAGASELGGWQEGDRVGWEHLKAWKVEGAPVDEIHLPPNLRDGVVRDHMGRPLSSAAQAENEARAARQQGYAEAMSKKSLATSLAQNRQLRSKARTAAAAEAALFEMDAQFPRTWKASELVRARGDQRDANAHLGPTTHGTRPCGAPENREVS